MRGCAAVFFLLSACTPFTQATGTSENDAGLASSDAGVRDADADAPPLINEAGGSDGALVATHMPTAPEIDGSLDDWATIPSVTINVANAGKAYGTTLDTVTIRVGWNDTGVFIACDVTDATSPSSTDSGNPYRNDACEVMLGSLPVDPTTFQNDYHLIVDRQARKAAYIPLGGSAVPPASVKAAATSTATGYVIEMFVPSNVLPALAANTTLAFDIQVDDNSTDSPDGQDSVLWLFWETADAPSLPLCDPGHDEPACNPLRWGKLRLGQ